MSTYSKTIVAGLVAIAREAGRTILKARPDPQDIEIKRDCSPVTRADRLAESVILRRLSRMFPGVPIVAEEAASDGHAQKVQDWFFLVDALDGTKSFIRGDKTFTVNIALIRRRVPLFGVVHAPDLDRTFHGGPATGAYETSKSQRRTINVRAAADSPLTAVASRSHGTADTDDFLNNYKVEKRINIGSSLKFCLVASGKADVYPRLGRTMEWDTAAGHAVLSAAGGRVCCLDGSPLLYGKCGQRMEEDYANPHFVALGDPKIPILTSTRVEKNQ